MEVPEKLSGGTCQAENSLCTSLFIIRSGATKEPNHQTIFIGTIFHQGSCSVERIARGPASVKPIR
jgi:hypothetical protein